MAGRYPDYDWRGIAMLTQQLGQLFEPSKARLMSQQQEHEMNMLMAKKAWDIGSERLDQQQKEYENKRKDYVTELNRLITTGALAEYTPEEIAENMGADSLGFLSIEGLKASLGDDREYSLVSFNGEYFAGGNADSAGCSIP